MHVQHSSLLPPPLFLHKIISLPSSPLPSPPPSPVFPPPLPPLLLPPQKTHTLYSRLMRSTYMSRCSSPMPLITVSPVSVGTHGGGGATGSSSSSRAATRQWHRAFNQTSLHPGCPSTFTQPRPHPASPALGVRVWTGGRRPLSPQPPLHPHAGSPLASHPPPPHPHTHTHPPASFFTWKVGSSFWKRCSAFWKLASWSVLLGVSATDMTGSGTWGGTGGEGGTCWRLGVEGCLWVIAG